ncbi:MAG: TIGR00266 family protein [Planctomycetota bacterium]
MKFELQGNPDYGQVLVQLDPGEKVYSESGAMSRMDTGMELRARLMGGMTRAMARKFLGGESFFLAEYQSSGGGEIAFSPALPGTVLHHRLDGGTVLMTGGCFLACSEGVDLRTRFGGLRSFFSGEGAFLIKAEGRGDLFLNAYGAVIEQQVQGGLTVDTGHVVAWEPSLEYSIGGMGGLKSTLLSGEGLVMKFRGEGRIWLQSRTLGNTAGWLVPYLLR